jgi:ribosomal protein S18 acetylase RimI-like enzyme
MFRVLDNPIWHALTTTDLGKNIGAGDIAFLDPDMAPFIGMPNWDQKSQELLLEKGPADRNWFLLIGEEVDFMEEWEILFSIPLCQFICRKHPDPPAGGKAFDIVPLDASHIGEMITLTELTRPGPFRRRTIEFGNYQGIFDQGKLVAMGGERLHIGGLTEISAICTHPDHLGKGHGARITHALTRSVLEKGQTPFLHARNDNIRAMDVYKRVGFELRREIAFYIFRRKPS